MAPMPARKVPPPLPALGRPLLAAALWGLCSCASSSSGDGSLSVLLEREDLIVEGLSPGEGAEDVRDGWSVRFDKYLVAIGGVTVRGSRGEERRDDSVHVVDLAALGGSGLALWRFDSLPAGLWDFWYETPRAQAGAARHESTAASDFETMQQEGWTYWIEGMLENPNGQSCPPANLAEVGGAVENGNTSGGNTCYAAGEVAFRFAVAAPARFGPCEIDGLPGAPVAEGGESLVAATIHGDHPFFSGFPAGDEGRIQRLAQWLADCDLDLDGSVGSSELDAIAPADLPEIDDRFPLGGSPLAPLSSMLRYVQAQLMTQGHFQGEGECPVSAP